MIDTIRVLIPLSKAQYLTAYGVAKSRGQDRWVFHKASTHSIWIRSVRDVATADVDSHERDVIWSVPGPEIDIATGKENYPSPPYYMTVELSLPKLWYGHNISLLYEWPSALELLKDRLKKWFRWRALPNIENWLVNRADFCYAWRMPDEDTAVGITELMKRLKYPRKRPQHYQGTAMWRSGDDDTYSAKIYAKGMEFRANDLPKLLKANADADWVEHLQERARTVVRWEITGKYKFLRRLGIHTVADLMGHAVTYTVTPELMEWMDGIKVTAPGKLPEPAEKSQVINTVLFIAASLGHIPLDDQNSFGLANKQVVSFPDLIGPPNPDGSVCVIPGGSIKVEFQTKTEYISQTYLKKLVGNGDMSNADEVKEILQNHYSGAKAGRLYQTWMMIQREGVEATKEMLGNDAFYRDVRKLRELNIEILEKTGVLINPGNDFWTRYRIEVPSPFVVNTVDDFRTHENLVNMADRLEAERKSG